MKEKIGTYGYIVVTMLLVFSFILIYYFNFGTAKVVGSSMYPTLVDGDFLFIHKTKNVKQGDIVAVYSDELNEMLIKRVVGVDNQKIQIDENGLEVDGELIVEDYVNEDDWAERSKEFSLVVEDNSVFCLGDNRNASTDSRALGTFSKSKIFGVCILDITQTTGITANMFKYIIIGLWCVVLAFSAPFVNKNINIEKESER